jgi:hypothetical protein
MTNTYSIAHDGIADLALPVELDQRAADALDGDHSIELAAAIDAAITEQVQRHGWDGDWSATPIVTALLARYAA